MNAAIQSLRYYFQAFLNSPHHLAVWVGAAAVLLISLPLLRLMFGAHRNEEPVPVEAAYPSMLGLSAPVDFEPETIDFEAEVPSIPPRNVTPINESSTVPCIHCGVKMSSRQDFCPACGYAQPMKQSFTA
jgi:hypothetical protein